MSEAIFSTIANYQDKQQLDVLKAMAKHYGADDVYIDRWNKTLEAGFVDEDADINFHIEARCYEAQQIFFEHLSEEEAKELGIQL